MSGFTWFSGNFSRDSGSKRVVDRRLLLYSEAERQLAGSGIPYIKMDRRRYWFSSRFIVDQCRRRVWLRWPWSATLGRELEAALAKSRHDCQWDSGSEVDLMTPALSEARRFDKAMADERYSGQSTEKLTKSVRYESGRSASSLVDLGLGWHCTSYCLICGIDVQYNPSWSFWLLSWLADAGSGRAVSWHRKLFWIRIARSCRSRTLKSCIWDFLFGCGCWRIKQCGPNSIEVQPRILVIPQSCNRIERQLISLKR